MKTFNNQMLLTTMLIMLAGAVSAQKVNEFTLQQAVDYAMQNSVQVRNAMLDIQLQKQTNKEITAAAYPQASGSAGITHYVKVPVQPIPDFIQPQIYGVLQEQGVKDGNGNPIVGPTSFPDLPFSVMRPWSASAGIDISQLLFDGQVFVGLQARDASIKFFEKQAEITSEQIKVNVEKIYYQLVVGKQQATSIDANISRFEKLLSDTREIYKNGFAEKLDVDKVNVQLNNLKTEKFKIENQLKAGNEGLKFLMGMPQKDSLRLTDTLSDEMIKENLLTPGYDYNNRKEVQLAEIGKKLNEYNIRRYQLSYIPTVALFGSYSTNAQRDKFDFFASKKWLPTALVGLKISVPVFDGFAKRARIDKAKFELQKTNNNIELLKAAVDNDVEQAKIKITSALLTMDTQKENMQLAEKVYNTTKLKYEQGLGSNQEIYNAQTELKVAQNNYYGALYDAVIARIDYLKATGKL